MTYILSGVAVMVPEVAQRPREAARPSPHQSVDSPLMGQRMQRPRNSGSVSIALANKFVSQVTALKGQQAQLEKLLDQMLAELKSVAAGCVEGTPMAQRAACQSRKIQLEKAIDLCITEIKGCASAANKAAIEAVKEGASQKEVIQAAASVSKESGNTPVIESATMQVTSSGQIVPGPGATVISEPVLTDPSKVSDGPAIPGANQNVNAAVGAAGSGGFPLGKVALGVLALWGVSRLMKKS